MSDAAPSPRLPRPAIEWDADGLPHASEFADGYFDRADPAGECAHVFFEGCGLPAAWEGRRHFTVAELGFGTGLTVLLLADLWQRSAGERPSGARLDILSVEGYPLDAAALQRAHRRFPATIQDLAADLRRQWPPPYRGAHRLRLGDGSIRLTLLFDAVEPALRGAEALVDAWFLDGFAPARNPDMWTEPVLDQVARLSAPGARIASFTAAGAVRRALKARGAEVERRPGFGRKRHCLTGRLPDPPAAASPERPIWCRPIGPRAPEEKVAVIGSGIAARWTALRLAEAGLRPLLVGPEPSDGTPPHPPAALIAPKLVRGTTAYARLSALSYLTTVREMERIAGEIPGLWLARGVLEPWGDADGTARRQDLVRTLDWPADWLESRAEGLFHPRAGVVDPAPLHSRLAERAVDLGAARDARPVAALDRQADGWRLADADGATIASVPTVILAAGPYGTALLPDAEAWAEIRHSGGRLFRPAPAGDWPDHALNYGGFVTPALGPAQDGRALLGASAHAAATPEAAAAAESGCAAESVADCLARLARVRPDLARLLDDAGGSAEPPSWTGVRSTTPDHLPLAGPVPDPASYRRHFRALAQGARATPTPTATVDRPGLFAITALGARGYQMAPFLAEAIASQLAGAPLPLAARDLAALHPARTLMRGMAREAPAGRTASGRNAGTTA